MKKGRTASSPKLVAPAAALPLAGLKVCDFTWQVAGSMASCYLADHGAEVVKIESASAPDILRITPPYRDDKPGLNRSYLAAIVMNSKKSLAVDLSKSEGVALVLKLVAWADVVMENFGPGTMKKLGLDYANVVKVNPKIIMISTSLMGQSGPRSTFKGFGASASAYGGLISLTGWPDRVGVKPHSFYTDVVDPIFDVAAILAALDYRRRMGKGQYIDLAQVESGLSFMGPMLLDATVNGRLPVRQGNRDSTACPHGAYRCAGEDRWCVIVVQNSNAWKSLGQAMGNPAWCADARFSTFARRKAHEDELDDLIAKWTSGQDAWELTHLLQQAGVPCAPVENGQDLLERDEQLRHRGFFHFLEHEELGTCLQYGWPVKFSQAQARNEPSPCLGEDNEYVCLELAGLSDEEFARMVADCVLE